MKVLILVLSVVCSVFAFEVEDPTVGGVTFGTATPLGQPIEVDEEVATARTVEIAKITGVKSTLHVRELQSRELQPKLTKVDDATYTLAVNAVHELANPTRPRVHVVELSETIGTPTVLRVTFINGVPVPPGPGGPVEPPAQP